MSTTIVLAVLLAALLHASLNALIKGGGDRWQTSGMIGVLVLGERPGYRRIPAAIMVAAGAAVLKFAG